MAFDWSNLKKVVRKTDLEQCVWDLHKRLRSVESLMPGLNPCTCDTLQDGHEPGCPQGREGYLRYECLEVRRPKPGERGPIRLKIKPEGAPDSKTFMVIREDTLPDLQAKVDEFVRWIEQAWTYDGEGGKDYDNVSLKKHSVKSKLRELGLMKKD